MKKILLGTTAIAAAALYAQTAQAQITVSLGGYTEFFGAYYDDDADNRTNHEFELETEIVVRADGKADNGLLYGAKIELQNSTGGAPGSTGVGTDEASVYLAGTWGRLELGDFDGAADTLAIYAPLVGIEQIDGDAYDFLNNKPTTGTRAGFQLGGLPNGGSVVKTPDSGDSTKIMYLTPRFAGFQAGASYATQNGSEAQDVVPFKTTATGGYKDFWEAGINWTGDFAGFSVAAGATTTGATGQNIASGLSLEDFWTWQAGAQVGYAGFKVGGGYYDGGDFNKVSGSPNASSDSSAWHLGASYTAGPLAVGVTYAEAQGYKSGTSLAGGVVSPGTYASDYQTYGGGVAYTLAPGFVVQADLMYVDEKLRNFDLGGNITRADNTGYVFVLDTRLNF
jgi:outer membrane protein OmpU